jgi:hypothetical protein
MRDQLIALLDSAEKFIRAHLINSSEELVSMFDLRDSANNSYLMLTPFTSDKAKDFTASLIRQYITKHKITHYLFLTEAWAITRRTYIPGLSQCPSLSDDRVEIILADAHSSTTHLSSSWSIKRKGPICIDLIPITTKQEHTPGSYSSGRFDHLLKSDDKRPI